MKPVAGREAIVCAGGAYRADPAATRGILHQAHIITPETRAHYFRAKTRARGAPSEAGDALLHGMTSQGFEQDDKPIIEAAYANLDGKGFREARPAFPGIDASGARARRMLQARRAPEQRHHSRT